MTITRITPPAEYLRTASQSSLESFELSKLNHAANLRRDIATLIDQWLTETAEALLARYMIEHRNTLREPALSTTDLIQAFQNPIPTPDAGGSVSALDLVPAPPRFVKPHPPITRSHGGSTYK